MDDAAHSETDGRPSRVSIFVSYATADRKKALSVCRELERKGARCWIACRDVAPGENYQEAIVRSLRSADAIVLVFSGAANGSNEIKKELSLASRFEIPVIALRIEEVEPSDAFAYELSTRQWIDAFGGWERAIDTLSRRVSELAPGGGSAVGLPTNLSSSSARPGKRVIVIALSLMVFIAVGLAAMLFRPSSEASHSMTVRLADFRALSSDLPANVPDLVREEIIAAFGVDGVIRVSTAATAEPGKEPAYLLGGTIRRDGAQIRVITRLTNERSGITLWTDSFDYDGKDAMRVPRRIAVDAGNMVHCGLFAASTYSRPLPDAVMSDYMQFCQNSWWSQTFSNPQKALDAAQKVAAAAPDFSWGWSAITTASDLVFYRNDPGPRREEIRRLGIEAADKALRLDPNNSEALAQKSMLVGRLNWAAQEQLLKQAIAARPLFCGCEHYLYEIMLDNVGRYSNSLINMRRSTEMLALDGISQLGLADALVVTGKADEAGPHFKAAVDLFRDPATVSYITINYAPENGDYAAALKALIDPNLRMSDTKRSALVAAFRALANGDAGSKQQSGKKLASLPKNEIDSLATRLIGALGMPDVALQIIQAKAVREDFAPASWLWYPSMKAAIRSDAFPGVAQRIGLIEYWRATHTRPDACITSGAPAFCKRI